MMNYFKYKGYIYDEETKNYVWKVTLFWQKYSTLFVYSFWISDDVLFSRKKTYIGFGPIVHALASEIVLLFVCESKRWCYKQKEYIYIYLYDEVFLYSQIFLAYDVTIFCTEISLLGCFFHANHNFELCRFILTFSTTCRKTAIYYV